MSVFNQLDRVIEEEKRGKLLDSLLAIPPNFFSMSFGLSGLAGAWRLANVFYGFPSFIGNILYLMAAVVFLVLLIAFITKLVVAPGIIVAGLHHSILGPFNALLPISGMLLAVGLEPYLYTVALVLFLIFFVATVLLGGWLTAQWILRGLDSDTFHPGYFLPTVAGCLLSGDGAAHFGLQGLSWLSFGIGLTCLLALGSLILNRLFFRSSLPAAIIPTLAIMVAPPAVAGNAYFTLTNGRIDTLTYILAGYTVLMVLVQFCFVPLYRRLSFTPSFWSFAFSYAAVVTYTMRWLRFEHPAGSVYIVYLMLAAITVFIGAIAIRTLIALREGELLPASSHLF